MELTTQVECTTVKALHIPRKNKSELIHVKCNVCKKWITNGIKKCKHPEKQRYYAKVTIPGTDSRSITKQLNTRDYSEALMLALEFKKELKDNNFRKVRDNLDVNTTDNPVTLREHMAEYLAYLNLEGVWAAMGSRSRSKGHQNNVKKIFKNFIISIEKNGYSKYTFKPEDLTLAIVREFLKHINSLHISDRYYNMHLSCMTTLYNFLNKKVHLEIVNYFISFSKQSVYSNPKSASKEDIEELLNVITPENGEYQHSSGKERNYYRPWLKHFVQVAYFIGARREDLVNLKYTDIIEDKNGEPFIINVQNRKSQRNRDSKNKSEIEHVRIIPSGIFPAFKKVLYDMGYDSYKNKDLYLFDIDETMNRETLTKFISKAVSHFFKKTTNSDLRFKNFRKTFATQIDLQLNGDADILVDHSDRKVTEKHYIDKLPYAKKIARSNFDGFASE